jgi:hypothetical protein
VVCWLARPRRHALLKGLGPGDLFDDHEMLLEPLLVEAVHSISYTSIADALLQLDQGQQRNGEH